MINGDESHIWCCNIFDQKPNQWNWQFFIISHCSLQYVEYTIHRGVLGANKELQHVVLEYRGDPVQPGRRSKFDSSQSLVLPALPTTLVGVCRMINVYYALHVSLFELGIAGGELNQTLICLGNMQVSLLLESEAEDLTMEFPVTIATVPFRIPNSPNQPVVYYGMLVSSIYLSDFAYT